VDRLHTITSKVEAEMTLALGDIQVVRKSWDAPIDIVATGPMHYLELSLLPTPKIAHGCFPDDWGPHRFERIGEVFLLPARHKVRAKSSCLQQSSVVCRFQPDAVATWLDADLEWTEDRLLGSLDIANTSIRNLLFRMGEEIRNPGFGTDTMVELMAGQVAVELSRYLIGIDPNKAMGGLAPWRLKLIDERLAEEAPPSLGELANLCNLSVRHLTRAFRISRGRSIGVYMAEQRVDRAKRLLVSGMSVKAVAYAIGFTAPSNFAAAFQRATGETPRQYRQRATRHFDVPAVEVKPH